MSAFYLRDENAKYSNARCKYVQRCDLALFDPLEIPTINVTEPAFRTIEPDVAASCQRSPIRYKIQELPWTTFVVVSARASLFLGGQNAQATY